MSEEITKLEQKLQEKIEKNLQRSQSVTKTKVKKIDAQHVRTLARRIQKTLTEQDYATADR